MTIRAADVPVDEISMATGLSREVLRKWESRYGFPVPKRNDYNDRVYPADQVARLRYIRRLMDAGHRPGRVVGMEAQELASRVASLDGSGVADADAKAVLDALIRHDVAAMQAHLREQLGRCGLARFVTRKIDNLNKLVGDAWLQGRIRVFEEHLYSKAVRDLLHSLLPGIEGSNKHPVVLLTTPPGELHTMGLTMAQIVLALEQAFCVSLDAQTPVEEIVMASRTMRIDIVALSFSIAYPAKDGARFLKTLRSELDAGVAIWAGGGGVAKLGRRRPSGVRYFTSLEDIGGALKAS